MDGMIGLGFAVLALFSLLRVEARIRKIEHVFAADLGEGDRTTLAESKSIKVLLVIGCGSLAWHTIQSALRYYGS